MILSDTLNQPLALAIYALFGSILGIIYMLNYFTCAFLIKSPLYRHISQSLYVITYGLAFFCVTFAYFDYDLKIYHLIISTIFTALVSIALYAPIRKRHSIITTKCDAFKSKVSQSRLIKRFKK